MSVSHFLGIHFTFVPKVIYFAFNWLEIEPLDVGDGTRMKHEPNCHVLSLSSSCTFDMYMRKVLISLGSNEMVIDMVLITKYSPNYTLLAILNMQIHSRAMANPRASFAHAEM